MKQYLEVTVFVSPAPGGAYTARVESIEAGAAEYPLALPFALADLAGIVFGVADVVRDQATTLPANPDRGGAVRSGRAVPPASARNFGAEMFEALFRGPGLEVLAGTISRARAISDAGSDTGVRLRISMNLQDAGMIEVAQLPWELMCRRDDDPLVVSDKTPLVRSFDVLHPAELRPFKGTLRILVVMSNPRGTPPLNLDAERAQIEGKWKALSNVQVDFAPPVRAELRRTLAGADYHVVHFMGHGTFDADKGGVLLMEQGDAERSPDPVSGKEFAVMLADEPLRLVYLNACKTGMAGGGAAINTVHPFAGVASALIKKGVPAVVAMQFPISDRAAIDFATTFYERIAQQFPVEAAVAQARNALYADGHTEWVTPVLYLRAKDGLLFTPATVAAPAAAAATVPVDPWGPGAAEAPRVFLAAPCEKLRPLHRTLARELRADGFRVIDSVPPPHEAAEHAAAVRSLIAHADLCVHLMGDTPGEGLDEGGALRTYPVEQLRLGLESAPAQLVVIPDLDLATIGDDDYRRYLESLAGRAYQAGRFELVRTSKLEIRPAIVANLRRRTVAGPAGDRVRAAFVDSHDLDLEVANELVNFLGDRDVEAFMHSSSAELFTSFGDQLKKYPLYILVAGKADRAWVKEREKNARSSAVAARAPILIGKYESGDDPVISIARLTLVHSILRPMPASVDALLTASGTA